jgi:hypothetical protein
MRKAWRLGVLAAWIAGTGVIPVQAQVELDRIVIRVGSKVITRSDLRQATLLKLVDDPSSDAAVQRCLEERWLILAEVDRGAPLPPTSESALASRRAAWEQSVGGPSAVAGLLAKARMSEGTLQAWLRDDLRIQAYLNRQFETLTPAERGRATSEWLGRLRQRAQMKSNQSN